MLGFSYYHIRLNLNVSSSGLFLIFALPSALETHLEYWNDERGTRFSHWHEHFIMFIWMFLSSSSQLKLSSVSMICIFQMLGASLWVCRCTIASSWCFGMMQIIKLALIWSNEGAHLRSQDYIRNYYVQHNMCWVGTDLCVDIRCSRVDIGLRSEYDLWTKT